MNENTRLRSHRPEGSRFLRLSALIAMLLLGVLLAGGTAGCSPASGDADAGSAGSSAARAWDSAANGTAELFESDGILGEQVSGNGLRHEVSTDLERATVDRVVDGDTLKVTLASTDESVRVRLIGMNTPESVAPDESRDTEEGVDASKFVKAYLSKGDTVWLMCDEEEHDKYGRILRYVWTDVPNDFTDLDEIRTKMLNAYIVDAGYAVVHAYKPNDAYCDLLYQLKDDARDAGRGLWAEGGDWAEGI